MLSAVTGALMLTAGVSAEAPQRTYARTWEGKTVVLKSGFRFDKKPEWDSPGAKGPKPAPTK